MDTKQIHDALHKVFFEEDTRIVFWNDPEKEFTDLLPDLHLDGVNIVHLDGVGGLEIKIKLERDDTVGRYLLYSPTEEPDFGEDWLLDIRLYSRSFRADRASIILNDLGLVHQSLRQHLFNRRKFFDNKERVNKIKALVSPTDNALDLDRKMLAVVTKADHPELFDIVRTLFHAMIEDDEIDLDINSPLWEQIEKFNLDESFWQMIKTRFGYAEDLPSLRNLLLRLFVSDYTHQLKTEIPNTLQNLELSPSGTSNAVVCLDQWRDSNSKGKSYNLLAIEITNKLQIDTIFAGLEIEDLINVMTFQNVDKVIVRRLLGQVSATAEAIQTEEIRSIVSRRQSGHWVASNSVPEKQRKARYAVYEAIAIAAEFFALRNKHQDGFDFESPKDMIRGYEEELYKFDQYYRHFCHNADIAQAQGWDLLKTLRDEIEACYCNWYLTRLGLSWGKFVSTGLLKTWKVESIPNQQNFYQDNIRPKLRESENRRVFVIISDAFRFEAAQELTRLLNGKYRFQAKLGTQISTLPSYTALGMASLLPHFSLEYSQKGDVLIDDKPCASLDQRAEILKRVTGTAIKADALLAMRQAEGRDFISGKKVIYIYHDEIDARGDTASTEKDTFDAVRKAIDDLADLVRYIINNLNGNYVMVTADHGFLFSETPPNETNKSKLSEKPPGTVKAKKRYLLGHNLPDADDVWHGKTEITAGAKGEMEFWIPKGANRFHFTGGARFIHGGAMLQEIIVPVITVKHLKDKKTRGKTQTKQVSVQVLGTRHRITAQSHRFKLVQMEQVSDRIKPVTLKVAVYEGDDAVTNIETLCFDSTTTNMDDRQKEVMLYLQDRPYNKKTTYRLVLREADTGIELQSVDVIIDRVITDDFDF